MGLIGLADPHTETGRKERLRAAASNPKQPLASHVSAVSNEHFFGFGNQSFVRSQRGSKRDRISVLGCSVHCVLGSHDLLHGRMLPRPLLLILGEVLAWSARYSYCSAISFNHS